MRCIAIVRRNSLLTFLVGSIISVVAVGLMNSGVVSAQATGVHATLCGATSAVTITHPTNDSTVSTAVMAIKGTVSQSNQVEVYIDDVFDSTIPLAVGQTHYESSVQLTTGTHTIKLIAINSCSGVDGSAQSVVTYAPPPTTSSNGSATSTTVGGTGNTISVGSPNASATTEAEPGTQLSLPDFIARPLEGLLDWLNITPIDTAESPTVLSLPRAIVVTAGMYLLIIGMASTVTAAVSASTFAKKILPNSTPPVRLRAFKIGFRILGLVILIGALFL